MHIIQIVTYAFSLLSLILSINAASNLVKNPGFDEAHSDCNSSPSWSQYNSSNLFSVCPQTDYYMVSKPNAMYLNSLEGWAGAVQTIDVSQTVVTSFNFSCMFPLHLFTLFIFLTLFTLFTLFTLLLSLSTPRLLTLNLN